MAKGKNSNLSHKALKEMQRELRGTDEFPDELSLRIHRALSWLGRAEKEKKSNDHAAAFIFYWVGFNAIYAIDLRSEAIERGEEGIGQGDKHTRREIQEYFDKIVSMDEDKAIADIIWNQYSGPIRLLLTNRYTFQQFWDFHNGWKSGLGWEQRFEAEVKKVERCFGDGNTKVLLSILFDRLYVLRNQIVHGGATWSGGTNREQVQSGASILSELLPIFILLMMENPKEDWGKPFYPVVEQDA